MSFGIDHVWRRKTIKLIAKKNPTFILDVATGTGDLAFAAEKKINVKKIIGLDISNGMLEVGREKIKKKSTNHSVKHFIKRSAPLSQGTRALTSS